MTLPIYGGVYHLSSLFMQFNMVYGMNIPCQHFKINSFEIKCCLGLLCCRFDEGHLQLSLFNVKS